MGIYLSKDGISYLWAKIKNKFYTKPSGGIPKSDLASSVQASLGKADSALQSHQDISGKQDKSTAVTHTASTAVGSATKPVYVAANGEATAITHSINADVPANAKFTDTTYSDATQSAHGLMAAADKKKLDGMDLSKCLPLAGGTMSGDIDMATNKKDILIGTQPASAYGTFTPVSSGQITTDKQFVDLLPTMRSYIGTYNYKTSSADSWYDVISVRHRNGYGDGSSWGVMIFAPLFGGDLQWNLNTNKDVWQGYRTILDSANYTSYAAKSNHTHAVITNSAIVISGANNAAKWCRLGTLVSAGNFSTAVISVWSGDGANGNASQNSWFEIHIKDGWQSSQSATKACGVTVYRTRCGTVKVKVIPTAHNTYTVWVYLPWAYWNGNYAVYGRYSSWTPQLANQTAEPTGTAADTSYYDYAFTSSTVANATTWNGLTQDCDTYNSTDTWLLVKNGTKIQHRLSYELKVKEATTLTDSGWVSLPAVSGLTPTTNYNGVKYRKQGKIVAVQGAVVFASDQSGPTIGQLPTGYRPVNGGIIRPGLDGATYSTFYISIGTDGKILFSTKTQGFFKKNSSYTVDVVFFVD